VGAAHLVLLTSALSQGRYHLPWRKLLFPVVPLHPQPSLGCNHGHAVLHLWGRSPIVAAGSLEHRRLPELVPAATKPASQKVKGLHPRASPSTQRMHTKYAAPALGQVALQHSLMQQLPCQQQPGGHSPALLAVPATTTAAAARNTCWTSNSTLFSGRQPSLHVWQLPEAVLQHLQRSRQQLVQVLYSSHLLEGLRSAPLLAGLAAIGIGSCPSLKVGQQHKPKNGPLVSADCAFSCPGITIHWS
jgi:hypothetical protein